MCSAETQSLASKVSEEPAFSQGHRHWVQLSFLSLIPVAACHCGVLNLRTKIKGNLNEEARGIQEEHNSRKWEQVIE